LAAGATFAFFTDSETSEGNLFQAGSIDLKVGNEAWYNGEKQENLSWGLADLENQLFFNFSDLKPGDWEEDTISLQVTDNLSWVCANLKVTSDDDMDCTESELENDVCEENEDVWDGELGEELSFIFWADDGDNVLETTEQVVLSGTPADLPSGDNNVGRTFPIVDSETSVFWQGALPAEQTVYIGKAFCFGNITEAPVTDGQNPGQDPGFVCDGELVTNAAQTDKLMGDLSFTAVQSRSNEEFVCGEKTVLGLDNKNPNNWERVVDETYGNLSYVTASESFDYDLEVRGLNPDTSYSLVYYKDPWPGTGGKTVGAFTTDGDGNWVGAGSVDLGTDLPAAGDENGAGAKLWVVLSSDWSTDHMTGWNPEEYLFEEMLVAYDDTDA
jgi:predicted ribosomally synthesized peptide with SipW-like signal peptide